MPSKNTRVALTLPDEVIAVLDRMGKVSGAGRATIIREWLIEGLPAWEGVATAMELAAEKNIDAFKVIEETLRDAVSEAEQVQLQLGPRRRAAMRKRSQNQAKEQPKDD